MVLLLLVSCVASFGACSPVDVGNGVNRVQFKTATATLAPSSLDITFTDCTPTVGDMILVSCGVSIVATVTGFSDNQSNTYATNYTPAPYGSFSLVMGSGQITTASGTFTVTATITSADSLTCIAAQYSGMATSSAFDKSASFSESGNTTPSSGNTATTTQATELLFGTIMLEDGGVAVSATSGTLIATLNTGTSNQVSWQDWTVSSTGTYASTWGISGGKDDIAAIVTYKIFVASSNVVSRKGRISF